MLVFLIGYLLKYARIKDPLQTHKLQAANHKRYRKTNNFNFSSAEGGSTSLRSAIIRSLSEATDADSDANSLQMYDIKERLSSHAVNEVDGTQNEEDEDDKEFVDLIQEMSAKDQVHFLEIAIRTLVSRCTCPMDVRRLLTLCNVIYAPSIGGRRTSRASRIFLG
eukprot:IDg13295t1